MGVESVDSCVTKNLEFFTTTIGKKPSAAANFLNDVGEVKEVLQSFIKLSAREPQYFSSADLKSMEGGGGGGREFEGLTKADIEMLNSKFSAQVSLMSGATNSQTISAGLTRGDVFHGMVKSSSYNALGGGDLFAPLEKTKKIEKQVSRSLAGFMNELDNKDDEEDEDDMFF